jgi:uncharacterized membrane protein
MLRHLAESFRRYFLRGLLAFLPLALTIWTLDAVVLLMERGQNILPRPLRPNSYLQFYFPGIGALFTVLLIWGIGIFVTHFVSQKAHDLWQRTLRRIPFVRGVYGAAQQLAEAIFIGKDRNFRRVVMIEYPRTGLYSLGFVTGVSRGEVQEKTRQRVVNVLIPTTPNPTSGWYVMVPEEDLIPLEMSVEDAFKLIISGGIVVPEGAASGARDHDRSAR